MTEQPRSATAEAAGGRAARLPPGCRYYVVGDVHGRADLLQASFAKIDSDRQKDPGCRAIEVYLGDYIDRGPASAEVIQLLIARRTQGDVVCLAGNHERMMLQALDTAEAFAVWCRFGGLETLTSYGVGAGAVRENLEAVRVALVEALPPTHLSFLRSLPLYHVAGDYLFVHAGVRPGVPLVEQSRDDLTMIREPFLSSEKSFGYIVVHGHTPVKSLECVNFRINLDTGAYATGLLTTIVIDASGIRQL